MNFILRILAIAWASPYTMLGLAIGGIGMLYGGRMREHGPVIEFYEGGTKWMMRRLLGRTVAAMTLGHVVLGRSIDDLDESHTHELVHVKQYERWGPMMGPAYIGCWIYLRLIGKNGYWDNPFEVEAYGKDGRS